MAKKNWLKENWYIPVIIVLLVVGGWWLITSYSPQTTTEPATATTLTLHSSVDNQVVDIPVSIHVPDSDTEFDSTNKEHLYPDALGDYWEELVQSKDSEDVEVDLTEYDMFYLEIDPDNETNFENDHHLYYDTSHQEVILDVYHLPTDAYIENNARDDGTRGVPTADGNYTLILTGFPNHPSLDWSERHVGDDFITSSSDYDDFSTSNKEKYNDEENWCSLAPIYNPENDDDKDFDDGLELFTKAPAFKFKFNDTISTTDGAVTQVNCTVENSEVETIVTGQYIYMIPLIEIIPGYDIDYELELGANITCSNIYSGTLDVPDDDASGISFTAFSYSL